MNYSSPPSKLMMGLLNDYTEGEGVKLEVICSSKNTIRKLKIHRL
jgi:hypothetical protein